jgi:O-antigen ligase
MVYLLSGIAVMAYAVWGFLQSGLQKSGDLADASSTWARVSGWQRAWETLVQSGTAFDLFFGYGITQAGHASDYRSLYPARGDGLFIDNTFVNIFLLQGLLGLLCFLAIWCWIWRRLLRKTFGESDPLTVGVTAFFSAFLAAGVFNILNGQWWGITLSLVLVILSRGDNDALGCATRGAGYSPLPNCC